MDGQSADILSSLLPLVALFEIFSFLFIKPQQKQLKPKKIIFLVFKNASQRNNGEVAPRRSFAAF